VEKRPSIDRFAIAEKIESDGFAIAERVVPRDVIRYLVKDIHCVLPNSSRSKGFDTYAIRNLLNVVDSVSRLAQAPKIRQLIEPVLGKACFPIKGILFDKNQPANWKVPWHQDLTIAVESRVEASGFGPWSVKEGIIHVQPPSEVLEELLAVRIHLDDCKSLNGALRVIPGTHKLGRLRQADLASAIAGREARVCEVGLGGVLLMRPLLVHASSASINPRHRRVIHLEFAIRSLPNGLKWFTQ